MSALDLWLTILLCIAAFGIIVGVPMWMVLRHPDRDPARRRRLPAYMRPRPRTRTTATRRISWAPPAWAAGLRRRELADRRDR